MNGGRGLVILVLLAAIAGTALVFYRVGYSGGLNDAPTAIRTMPKPTETRPAEVAELKEERSACSRALSWYIPQLLSAEGLAENVKDALLRGDNSAAESSWNNYLSTYYNEYFTRALEDDVSLCGLPNNYVRLTDRLPFP
jgi:hypothetical protein